MSTSTILYAYLVDPTTELRRSLEEAVVSARLVEDFRPILPNDGEMLAHMCELGAAWAIGRQSVSSGRSWQPVVTGPDLDPLTFERLTAETLIALVVAADRRIRLFAPYVDARGIEPLAFALAAATRRGVDVCIGYRPESDRTHAIEKLSIAVREGGDPNSFSAVAFSRHQSFPHLKILVADGARAYIGSANLTYAALTTNYEVGAVVEGEEVHVYEVLLEDLLQQRGIQG